MKREAVKSEKLTDRQLAVLRELAKPDARAYYQPYMGRFNPNAYWFLSTTMRRATKEVRVLVARGLLDTKSKDPFGGNTTATINAKGRRLLTASRKRSKA